MFFKKGRGGCGCVYGTKGAADRKSLGTAGVVQMTLRSGLPWTLYAVERLVVTTDLIRGGEKKSRDIRWIGGWMSPELESRSGLGMVAPSGDPTRIVAFVAILHTCQSCLTDTLCGKIICNFTAR
jgi:hypothetical protein